MTRKEFSDSFAVLLNSYARKAVPGDQNSIADIVLDEYEKSVFLTKAQNDIVIELYNGSNKLAKGFEETEELRRYLAPLIKTSTPEKKGDIEEEKHIVKGSVFFELPPDLLFITFEQIEQSKKECPYEAYISVVPITQDSYNRIKNNPFKGPTKYKALRLDYEDRVVEIIPPKEVKEFTYFIKYLREPKPIILENFSSDDLYIGEKKSFEGQEACELNSVLHNLILERAVYLAAQYKGITLAKDNK